jgi:hypothetical protein
MLHLNAVIGYNTDEELLDNCGGPNWCGIFSNEIEIVIVRLKMLALILITGWQYA